MTRQELVDSWNRMACEAYGKDYDEIDEEKADFFDDLAHHKNQERDIPKRSGYSPFLESLIGDEV